MAPKLLVAGLLAILCVAVKAQKFDFFYFVQQVTSTALKHSSNRTRDSKRKITLHQIKGKRKRGIRVSEQADCTTESMNTSRTPTGNEVKTDHQLAGP